MKKLWIQKILGLEKFWARKNVGFKKIFWCKTNFGSKKSFGSTKILDPREFGIKNFGPKILSPKRFLGRKTVWPKKNVDSKNTKWKQSLSPKIFVKKFGSMIKQYLGPVNFGPKFFWSIQIFVPTIIWSIIFGVKSCGSIYV